MTHLGTMLLLLNQMTMAFTVRLLLLSSLFLLPISVSAQTNGNISVGASLSATEAGSSSWLSPSGDFAFGFRQLENNDLFWLSIWYAKIPDKTTVWYANMDSPAPKGSIVKLTANSGLVLTTPQGVELWKTATINGVVAFGVMNDTGNFVLQDDNSKKLWETFKNLTDTMLPGQTIEKGGKLSCRKSETNYSKGQFQLRLEPDGSLVLSTINLPTERPNKSYYTSGTGGLNSSNAGIQLVFNESGSMYVLRQNGEEFTFTRAEGVSPRDYYIRATLNFDGVLTQYYHPKNFTGNGSWTPLWIEPDNICLNIDVDSGSGVCGYNSICTLKSDQRASCECPTGYSLLDPNDPYGSCKPDFIQGCEEDELSSTKDLYDVVVLANVDWRNSDYAWLEPFTADKCNASCFQDCFCAVAIFRNETCWKKKLPLANGRVDDNLNSKAFIKVRKHNSSPQVPQMPSPEEKKNKNKKQTTLILVGSVLLGTSVFVNFMFIASVCLGFFLIFRKRNVRFIQNDLDTNLRCFSYKELEEATKGFTEELGRGSFGVVYKGMIQIGSGIEVAVKKLNCVIQDGEKEFKTELKIIGKTHHKNLVRLVGYCEEGQQRLLVYEFLSNGTLASFLFADVKPSWKQRTEIAYGVAKGLLYLHEECSAQIIHCDIKPQNILLDDYNNPRIADFGLAKLLMLNQSHTHTAIRGTKGYVAPEWFRNMPITTKVDVYSFGVVLLEIICCRRSVDVENSCEERAILTDWVYDCYREGVLDPILDYEVEALDDRKKLQRFVMVGIWCIQEDPSLRPIMMRVVQMLEGVVEVHVPPCPSPYSRAV